MKIYIFDVVGLIVGSAIASFWVNDHSRPIGFLIIGIAVFVGVVVFQRLKYRK